LACTIAALAALTSGCGGTSSQPPAEPDGTTVSASGPSAVASSGPTEAPEPTASPAQGPPPTKGPSTVANNQDYEISDRDCHALATVYAEAWRLDEQKKIPEGVAEAQRTELETELEGSSAEMREQYLGQCRNTVGTAYPYDNLKCALKAKTMQRFDDCMVGKI